MSGSSHRARWRYSRWDGTQRGFELDADELLGRMTDDLIEHGDASAAMRRLMNDGMRDANGERLAGLRELLDRIRAARRSLLDRHDLGGVYDDLARELDDIVDEERHALAGPDAPDDGVERGLELDLLPDDLPGKVAGLQQHRFASPQAEGRFEAMLDRLRQQFATQMFDQMSGAMQQMTPEGVERMKDMMAALNEMLERRRRGEDPGFEQFMDRFGDFFPERPETLDELLEQMARRMAAMQAMLNSMSPEQRRQLQELSEQLLGDMDLQWQMEQLGEHLRALAPQFGWGSAFEFGGDDPLGMGEALDALTELGDLSQLESLMRGISSPTELAEADMDRVRDLLGDDAARSLQRLSELSRQLAEAGLIDQTEQGVRLTPRALRAIGANALRELFSGLSKEQIGQHELARTGWGHERSGDTKPYEHGDPFRLDLQRTIRNALARRRDDRSLPVRLEPGDFEIEQVEHLTRSATVLLLDLSMSMPMEGRFVPAKKVAMALHALITSQFPRDYLGVVVFSETARVIRPDQIPEASWDYVYGTNMHHGLTLARDLLARQPGNKQIIMVTDGEPTAHITPSGDVFFRYPPVSETIEATLREVLRCTKAGIRINTFMLGESYSLRGFVERMAEINQGRAFFTTPENLGDYVLVDFLQHRRERSSRRRAG